jgi:hypothetical protein
MDFGRDFSFAAFFIAVSCPTGEDLSYVEVAFPSTALSTLVSNFPLYIFTYEATNCFYEVCNHCKTVSWPSICFWALMASFIGTTRCYQPHLTIKDCQTGTP